MFRRETLLQPRLKGERFKHHALPLEILRDFSALRDLIFEAAKTLYLRDHPKRKRAPKNFHKGISLNLTQIGSGSATPQIEAFVDYQDMFPSNLEYFKLGVESINQAINAAANNDLPTEYLPDNLLTFFNQIGRSLEDDETMEFLPNGGQARAPLNTETRHRLIAASSAEAFIENAVLRGHISGYDKKRRRFFFQPVGYQKHLTGPIQDQHKDIIVEAAEQWERSALVRIEGTSKYDRHGNISSLEDILTVSPISINDSGARIDSLRSLRDGWHDGEGKAPPSFGLSWAAKVFDLFYPDEYPTPYIYPTLDGRIRIEWRFEKHDPSLEIDTLEKIGHWHLLDLETLAEEECDVDLSKDDDWGWVLKRLSDLENRNAGN